MTNAHAVSSLRCDIFARDLLRLDEPTFCIARRTLSATLDAVIRRATVFACAVLGTFVLYLAVGELTGVTDGTPIEYLSGLDIALVFGRAAVILTSGHAIALGILAFALRGYAAPSYFRSAAAGAVCTVILEMAYLSNSSVTGFSVRGVVRLGLATVVSLAICAVRARRHDQKPVLAPPATSAVAVETA